MFFQKIWQGAIVFIEISGGLALLIGSMSFAYETWMNKRAQVRTAAAKIDDDTVRRQDSALTIRDRQIADLQGENNTLNKKIAEQDVIIAKAQNDIAVLQSIVTGKDAIEQLTKKLDGFSMVIPAIEEFRTNDHSLLKGNQDIIEELKTISTTLTTLSKAK